MKIPHLKISHIIHMGTATHIGHATTYTWMDLALTGMTEIGLIPTTPPKWSQYAIMNLILADHHAVREAYTITKR